MWVDDNVAQVKTFTGVYTDANTYDVYMGQNFAGVLRSVGLRYNLDWDCANE